jgi:nucleoside-diphosphate-sugar epimerase
MRRKGEDSISHRANRRTGDFRWEARPHRPEHRHTASGQPSAAGHPPNSESAGDPDVTRILVTGAGGQIGTELVQALRGTYGETSVLATDLRPRGNTEGSRAGEKGSSGDGAGHGGGDGAGDGEDRGPFRQLDCTDVKAMGEAFRSHRPRVVYHLAALLSAVGERHPLKAYQVNLGGLMNVLEACRETGCALFTPSSIAAFGPDAPRDPTPQDALQRPRTMYGVSKVAGELLCDYYHTRFGLDTRGVRFPGIISHSAPPGGGTTDYAVEIFHAALDEGCYPSFLAQGTQLDMMYMPDAVRAAMELMEADPSRLRHRNAFNVTAMQLTPERLATAIQAHLPSFRLEFEVDPVRQAIADSWPRALDDSAAREEWGWAPRWNLEAMTEDMLENLRRRRGERVREKG